MSERIVVTDQGIGRLDGEEVTLFDTAAPDLRALLEAGEDLTTLAVSGGARRVRLDDVALRAPVASPRQIWAVGLNYRAHVEEIQGMTLTEPFIFPKASTAVIGPGAPILIPEVDGEEVDFEGELAIIIGKRAERIRREDADSVIAGVTICNDVSARTLQKGGAGIRPNISLAKSFRTFAPLGPAVLPVRSADELRGLRLRTLVNGEVRQDATTDQLIFDIPTLIEYLTARVTLLPGDIIATGTPEGVGDVDGRYLAGGDVVRIELEGIGALENPVAHA